jgi:hypothetical protein
MARDLFHEAVRKALVKDGWTITHDPYPIRILDFKLDVDLGAERMIAAERETGSSDKEKIAVEIKSFLSASFMRDFHNAVGQYTNYNVLLHIQETDRKLYLAVPRVIYELRFEQPGIRFICEQVNIALIVYDEDTETIALWRS